MNQLSLFGDEPKTPVVEESQDASDRMSRPSTELRSQVREQLGGWWCFCLHTGRKVIAPGMTLWLPTGKAVGVYRIDNVVAKWNTADLHCFALRGDELVFGFLHSEFLKDPERYVRDRKLTVWQPQQLWEFEPPAERRQQARKAPEQMSMNRLRELIWEWMTGELATLSSRKGVQISLEERDKLMLNNTYWFCHKQLGEVAQRLSVRFDQNEFDYQFWQLLDLAAACTDDQLPDSPPIASQIRPVPEASITASHCQTSS